MVDLSRLDDHARMHGWRYIWRTWREGAHWHASVKAWKDGAVVGWFGSSTLESEQMALDLAIDVLIKPPEKPAAPYP